LRTAESLCAITAGPCRTEPVTLTSKSGAGPEVGSSADVEVSSVRVKTYDERVEVDAA
jgi:hypothetical protein